MSTNIRPELSEKNPYWISRHRYYELLHFIKQYPEWKKALKIFDVGVESPCLYYERLSKTNDISDPTARLAMQRIFFKERIKLIDDIVKEVDTAVGPYILEGILKGASYETMNTKLVIPCSKDTYYQMYRKFFWILNYKRN